MIEKVISGGQIGADVAGLDAAECSGIPTGGHMPKGFRTIDGPAPQIAERYGLEEAATSDYPSRTRLNVLNSDGTIRLALNWSSPGERRTLAEIKCAGKPHFDVDLDGLIGVKLEEKVSDAKAWVSEHDIRVLNVAGNARADIEPTVWLFITRLIDEVNG